MSGQEQIEVFVLTRSSRDVCRIERYFDDSALSAEVTWCNRYSFALQFLDGHNPDIILVSHQLKKKTGFDFANECTGRGYSGPFILLGEREDAVMASKARRSGFNDYFSKRDLSPEALQRLITSALEDHRRKEKLEELARTDQLTGLLNRHAIFKRLKGELKRASRNDNQSTTMLLDVDDFKEINDTHGHVAGDRVLQNVAKIVREKIRDSDFAGRYGGDEFLIISPNTKLNGICKLGERIQEEIGALAVSPPSEEQDTIDCSVSAGCACFDGAKHERIDQQHVRNVINQADSALYVAKDHGGNAVERRKSERVPVEENDVDTEIIFEKNRCNGKVIDYSKTGIRVETSDYIPQQESVKLLMNGNGNGNGTGSAFQDTGKELSGQIAWTSKTNRGVFMAGIRTKSEPPL